MIKVKRPNASEPVKRALNKRSPTRRMSEFEEAMWFYADVEPDPRDPMPVKPTKAPDFKVYRHNAVKDALDEIFKGHCAYCESRYAHVVKMDVEHYRPKGAVVEDDGAKTKPGYYWLAAVWENLLPSCNLCNRAGTHKLMHADGSVVEETKGKASFFPLLAGTMRATKPGEEKNEEPLLLNPCNPDHDPNKHLLFRSDGLVEPRDSQEERDKPRGMATIDTCALHRSTLVEIRRSEATRLRDAMVGILRADRRCALNPTDEIEQEDRAAEEAELEALIPDLNFRAMTRELRAVFEEVRAGINSYFDAEHNWRIEMNEESKQVLVVRATVLRKMHAEAGLHQPFVAELMRNARIPLRRLAE